MRLKRLLCLESLLVMINISTFSMSYDYLARSNDQKANTFIFQELSNSEYHMSDIFLNYEKTNDLLLIQSALSVAGFTFFTQNLSYDNDELKMIQAGYFFNFKYVGVGQIFKEYQVPFNKSDDLKKYIDEYKGFIPSVFYNSEEYYSASIDDILIVPTGIKNELINLDGFVLLNRIKPKQLFIHGLSNLNKILSDDLFGDFGIAGNFNIQDVSGSFVQPYYIHKLSNTLKLKSSITFQNNNSSFTDLISYATEAYYSHDLFKISSRLNYNNDIGFGYSITVNIDDFVYFFPRYSVVLGYNDTACLNNIPTTGFYFGFFSKITFNMR